MPKVSVIMSVYNERRYLIDSIQSILNQTFQDFEFIIIDDYSEDVDPSVRAVINSFTTDARIKLIRNGANIGLTKSLNKGLFASSGEYIARQDADDVSERVRLQHQVRYLDNHPEIGVLGTSTTIINEIGDEIDEWEAAPNPMESLKVRNGLTHGSVMFRRTVMEDVGKYDENFRYAQDYEYWLRISKKYQIRNLPSRLYQSRVHYEMISFARTEAQARYVILAQRKATLGLDAMSGQWSREEKIRFHTILAYSFTQMNLMNEVNHQMEAIFQLDPLNIENLIRKIAYILNGRAGIIYTQNTYRKLRKEFQSRKQFVQNFLNRQKKGTSESKGLESSG